MQKANALIYIRQVRANLKIIGELCQLDVNSDYEGIAVQNAIRSIADEGKDLCTGILDEHKKEVVKPLRRV